MVQFSLKDFVSKACNILGISVQELKDNKVSLYIPDDLLQYFSGKITYDVTLSHNPKIKALNI
ncbi:MAG: hypothetical protein ACYDG2_23540 [Ruminiclostridium sp.]